MPDVTAESLRLAQWLAEVGPFSDPTGRATRPFVDAARGAGFDLEPGGPLNARLRRLEDRGLVERTIRGKRCFQIAAGPALRSAPLAVPDLPPTRPEPEAPAAAPVAAVPAVLVEPEPEPEPEREPLVGTVHLALDVDPALARLVLDLVERGTGVRPVGRDEVGRMIERAVNRETSRAAEGMSRVMARIDDLEQTVGSLAAGMRGVGVNVATNGHKARPVKPDFRALGVKDSAQRKLLTDLAVDGWTLTRKQNGHIAATKDDHKPLELSATPSDHRTPLNERARARAAGAAV